MTAVFLNGKLLDPGQALVSAFDAGLQHAVGLFETMVGGAGGEAPWVHRLEDHLDRLIASTRALGLSERLRKPALGEAVLATVRHTALARSRVRLTVTGGDLHVLSATASRRTEPGRGGLDPTVLIVAQPATDYPAEWFDRGVTAVVADLRVNPLDPLSGHKTLNYWGRLRELQTAASKHAGEALVFGITNHLAGGCVSNAFVVRRGELWTPFARGEEGVGASGTTGVPVPSPVLPGIARAATIEIAERAGLNVVKRMIALGDILASDELFLTNSSWGVLPVVRLEREAIGDGTVGPVTQRLRDAWLRDQNEAAIE